MRVLAIDYGDARTGIAVSDALGMIVGQTTVIHSRNPQKAAQELARLVKECGAERLVMGFPRNMDGSYGFASEKVRAFAAVVLNGWEGEHDFFDERLSTVAAERALFEAELNWKKRRKVIDRLAAQVILEGYMTLHPLR